MHIAVATAVWRLLQNAAWTNISDCSACLVLSQRTVLQASQLRIHSVLDSPPDPCSSGQEVWQTGKCNVCACCPTQSTCPPSCTWCHVYLLGSSTYMTLLQSVVKVAAARVGSTFALTYPLHTHPPCYPMHAHANLMQAQPT